MTPTTHASTATSSPGTSADQAVARFDSAKAAAKYSTALIGTTTHRREVRCILGGLNNVSSGAGVLDLPCGTGRLLPALTGRGFRVTSADSSPHMVDLAKLYAHECHLSVNPADFVVANVLETPFSDGQFEAVVCNRLFHHFREPLVRQDALRELMRICRGPIIASFFCSASWDGVVFHIKNSLRRHKATDRIPIPRRVFEQDVRAASLRVSRWLPIRPGISKQWYAVLERPLAT